MPTYKFKCHECDMVEEVVLSMRSLDQHVQTCYHCETTMVQVIQAGRLLFNRSEFPREAFEHADYEPRVFRDKIHLRDHCEEVGLRSRLLEDGDVPL